jgi:hypothetical protein
MISRSWAYLLLLVLLAPAANAQFDLVLVDGTVERSAPAVYDFGVLYENESASAHFRLRNTSAGTATLNTLAVRGAGFTLTSPALPVGLTPQQAVDFAVVFRATDTGAYSASLNSDGASILLTATVAPRLTYRVDSGVGFPGTLDFGSVVHGGSAERRIVFRNDTSGVLFVPAISVQGVDFALTGAPTSGQVITPGQGGEFTIDFTPQDTGQRQGSITLGDRSYPLLGTGVGPPLPAPRIALDLKQAASAQQGTMIVRFDAPAQTSGSGTATLDFRGPADTAIGFAAGGRTVNFPISPGDVQAVLPFQTGTSAGVFTFTAEIGGTSDHQSLTIAASTPGIATTEAVRTATGVELRITGFDNTRTLSALAFTFYDATGKTVAPGTIRTDAASDFARYFAGSDLGGVFAIRAVFPVTGDAHAIVSCETTLTNSSGSSSTQRTFF